MLYLHIYVLGTCGSPPIPANAFIKEKHDGVNGAVAFFECNDGYNASNGLQDW